MAMLSTEKEMVVFAFGALVPIMTATKSGSLEPSIALGLLGFIGLIVAVRKYLYEKARDRKKEIVELVSFFRNEVMRAHEDFLRAVRKHEGDDYEFPRIQFKEASIKHLKDEFATEAAKQIALQKKDSEILYLRHNVANILEEFALRVYLAEAQNSKELLCLKQAYIEVVETHAEKIILLKTVVTGGDTFSEVIDLYFHWFQTADNLSIEDRLEKELKEV